MTGLAGIEVEGFTRASLILRGALAAGAAYGTGAVGPFVARAFAQVPTGDIEILQFALGLENLQAGFYKAALAQAGLTGRIKDLATEFGTHEAAHADTIKKLIESLGGKPNPPAKAKFDVKDQKSFLRTAIALEETGVSAYNGAAPAIQTPDLLAAAGGIVQTEARHAGALRMLAGQDPAPAAFDKALAPDAVLQQVKPFLQTS